MNYFADINVSLKVPGGHLLQHLRLDFDDFVEKKEDGLRDDLQDTANVRHLDSILRS
jgi:hypothetical protein